MEELKLTNEDFVYSRIGMALVSAQRVEFLTGQLLEHLVEFDKSVYGITTEEFLERSAKSNKAYKTLGTIFSLLKLNPKLVIEDELNEYLKKRNIFVHEFWKKFLSKSTVENVKSAIEFCYDFGIHSDRISRFFQGLLYYLALRSVKNPNLIDAKIKKYIDDYNFFIAALEHTKLSKA